MAFTFQCPPRSIFDFVRDEFYLVENRLRQPLRDLFMAIESYTICSALLGDEDPRWRIDRTPISMKGTLPLFLWIPYGSQINSAVRGTASPGVEIMFCNQGGGIDPDEHPEAFNDGSRFFQIFDSAAAAQFIVYFERYKIVVHEDANNQRDNWHPVWQFARVVRNSISHNAIRIDDPNHPPVSWHSITLSREDNGSAVLGERLRCSDLIMLMIEMDLALDELRPDRPDNTALRVKEI